MTENFLITFLVAFLSGGAGAAIISHFFQARKEEKKLLRRKGEELYVATDGFCLKISEKINKLFLLLFGHITLREFYETDKEDGKIIETREKYYQKMVMLTSIYFPKLLPKMEAMYAARGEAFKIGWEIEKKIEKKEKVGEKLKTRLREENNKYLEVRDEFLESIVKAVRDL